MTHVLALEVSQSNAVLTAAVWLLCYPSVYQWTYILGLLLRLISLSGKPCQVMTICSYEWLKAVDKCCYLEWIIFRGLVHVLSKMWNLAWAITRYREV